ncbi:MAG: hypothetical protein HDQ96_10150 [Lachnospiraceae bacterium]|nr:hypothetical protein [Lachnospiraceae bacterium]
MKKKIMSVILATVFMFSLIGCGNDEQEKPVIQEITQDNVVEGVEQPESTKEGILDEPDAEEASVNENEDEDEYIEQRDIFVCKEIDTGDGTEIDFSNKETIRGPFIFTESTDIYSYYFTYAGYTKPDIEIHSVGKVGDWIVVPFAQSSFLVKAEDFEKVAVLKDDNSGNTDVQEVADNQTVANEAPVENTSTEETPVETVSSSDKYTPEEAIAVYRSLMEAGGMTWDPSLKNGGSWGTGWIYLEKGQPERSAAANLESAAMGDSVGNPWTNFYLEITGSDENAVYITEWAD